MTTEEQRYQMNEEDRLKEHRKAKERLREQCKNQCGWRTVKNRQTGKKEEHLFFDGELAVIIGLQDYHVIRELGNENWVKLAHEIEVLNDVARNEAMDKFIIDALNNKVKPKVKKPRK